MEGETVKLCVKAVIPPTDIAGAMNIAVRAMDSLPDGGRNAKGYTPAGLYV